MSSDNESIKASQIDTSGGPAIDGDVNTGVDFIGRDKTIHGDEVRVQEEQCGNGDDLKQREVPSDHLMVDLRQHGAVHCRAGAVGDE